MPELSSKVLIDIITDSDEKGIESGKKAIADFAKSAVDSAQKVAIGFGIMAAGAVAFGASALKDYQNQEDALSRLQTGINNVKSAKSKDIAVLTEYADALQKTTRFADEEIESGMSMLTTFQLNQGTIKQLTPGMLDMAEAFRKSTGETMDLEQISILFGKTMGGASEDIDGMSSTLKRMGVIMTEEQKAVFKFGTEGERAATIAQIMDLNFKGFAEGGAKTSAGKMAIMNNQIGEVKEALGKMIAEGLAPVVDYITTNVLPTFENMVKWFKEHETASRVLAGVLIAVLGVGFTAIAITAGAAAISFVGAAITMITSLVSLAAAGIATGIAMAIAFWPITLAVAAIIAIVGLLYLAWQTNFMGIQQVVQQVGDWFTSTFVPALQTAFAWIGSLLTTLGQIFMNVWNLIIKPLLGLFVSWFNNSFWIPLKTIFDWMTKVLKDMGLSWSDVWNGIKNLVFKILEAIVNEVKSKINFVISAINALINGANSIGGKVKGYTNINTIPMLAEGVRNFAGGLAIVGERGPELVNLPRGSSVTPNSQLGGFAGVTVNQVNYIREPFDMDQANRELGWRLSLI